MLFTKYPNAKLTDIKEECVECVFKKISVPHNRQYLCNLCLAPVYHRSFADGIVIYSPSKQCQNPDSEIFYFILLQPMSLFGDILVHLC